MKKNIFLGVVVLFSSTWILAATTEKKVAAPAGKTAQQNNQMSPSAGCSRMSVAEQNFSTQLQNSDNQSMFCSQFTPQQRQQAMQMRGQKDNYGNTMNADDAVQQVMQMNSIPYTQRKPRSGGGCPVK